MAKWKNFYTRLGAVWHPQSVSDALSVDDLIMRAAEAEYARTIAIEAELFRREIRLGNNLTKANEQLKAAKARAEDSLEHAREEAKKVRMLMRGTAAR